MGEQCQVINHCYDEPCKNNGSCVINGDSYQCACPAVFTGPNCEVKLHCSDNSCKNNGTCDEHFDNYTCDCLPGFTGDQCQGIDHCYDEPCKNNGSCVNSEDGYQCICSNKFTGARCEVMSHCYDDPCKNNGTCRDHSVNYTCECLPGFMGELCQVIDHCYDEPCLNNGSCASCESGYKCTCPAAYTGPNCEVKSHCYDNPCENSGTCRDYPGNYTCECLPGFMGENCQVIDHCYDEPCKNNGSCVNSGNAYQCTCPAAFTGPNCEVKLLCSDNPCNNNGTCNDHFDNYTCVCLPGFTGDQCQGIDYCFDKPCKNNGSCVNSKDGYQCTCSAEFTGADCEVKLHCYDNPCKNNGTCHNHSNNYTCKCRPGFMGEVCQAIDCCYDDPCLNNGSCINSLNGYNCTCPAEFTGVNCEVHDLCRLNPCNSGGTCSMSQDYYRCDCPDGLTGAVCENDVDECFNSPCMNNASSCTNTFGSYECNCASGFTGRHCQIGIPADIFDVLLLFDGSSNLGSSHFYQTRLFAKAFLSNYNISKRETNVAAAVYANNTSVGFNFTQHFSYEAVSVAIERIPFLDETPLNLGNALNIARQEIFPTGRPNVPDVLVIFVSFSLSQGFAAISQTLRDEGVKIIVIAIDSNFNIPQLEQVASTPASHYLITTSYHHMDTMENSVSGAVSQAVNPCSSFPCQNGGNCTRTGSNFTCSCPSGFKGHTCEIDINECIASEANCKDQKRCVNTRGGYQCICPGGQYGESCEYSIDTKLDLAFLIDGSQVVTEQNFLSFTSFAKAISASLNVSRDETHVSVAIYGAAPALITLSQYNQSAIDHVLDNAPYTASLQSNLGEALLHLASKLYNTSNPRANTTRVLVILTASKSQDDLLVPSNMLLNHYNVKVFVLAVGNEYSHGQLNEVSSDPDTNYIHTSPNGHDLSTQVVPFREKLFSALDPCSSGPCVNGTCQSFGSGYTCFCQPGYSGINCDQVNDSCSPDPCKNHGSCQVLRLNSYYCACPEGWTGTHCEQDVKECSMADNVCQNGGTCDERMGYYICNCQLGFAGKNCTNVFQETMIDLVFMIDDSTVQPQAHRNISNQIVQVIKSTLSYFPSQNTRVGLVLYAADTTTVGNFNATRNETNQALDLLPHLPEGTFTGKSLNYTREHFFNNSRANAHRVLVVFTDETSNDVVSVASKLLRDMNVTIIVVALGNWFDVTQVNNMASHPRSSTVLYTTHVEIMEIPWRVHEMIGEAVDHCFSNPCVNNGTCNNSLHSYRCSCPEGFTGSLCEEAVDHCFSNPCANNGTCNNSLHGYRCSCPEGFTGSLCEEAVDHCFSNPCANNGTCNNSLHSYRCSCPEGFTGSLCEEVNNEDKCGSSPCINDGTCITVGRSYQCDCRRGFYGRQCQLDVDECYNSPCINNASSCTNTFGSYECNCASGFTGRHCQIGIPADIFDVLLLFDGSSYLGSSHFYQTLLFAKAFLSNYNISKRETNVATAVYANNTSVGFNFTQHFSYEAVAAAIERIPFLDETPLNLGNALNIARQEIFPTGRPNVPDVLVIFVSFSLSNGFASISQTLQDEGVKIIVIAIDSNFNIPQLEQLANTPASHYLVTTSYHHMDTMENSVSGAVSQAVNPCSSFPCQNGGNCSRTRSNFTCSCPSGFKGHTCEIDINECIASEANCKDQKRCVNTRGGYQCICPGGQYGESCEYSIDTKLDLAFLIDGSQVVTEQNFLSFTSFAKAISASLNVSRDETRVSVAIYGVAPALIIHNQYNQSAIEHVLDNAPYTASLQSNLGEALLHLASKLYNTSNPRPNATRVLVILTASKSQDDLLVPSNMLLNHYNVKVFVLAVGNEYSHGQLNEVSSDPDENYIHTSPNGHDLSTQVVPFREDLLFAVDPCSSGPCMNGTCQSFGNGYTCLCQPGYSGINCDQVNDPCSPDPCKNHGSCQVLRLNSYYCACPEGWTGAHCEEDVKECSMADNVCQNGGTCDERMGYYICNCQLGFAGKNCTKVFQETMIDLVFMIDDSTIQPQAHSNVSNQIVQVIKSTLSYFPSQNTRVGLVLYAADTTTVGNFNATRNETNQALDLLPHLPEGTFTGKSLNYTREHFFNNSRANAHRVLVVFTDETSNDVVSVASKLLRDMNVTIIVVALGNWFDVTQVNNMASHPRSSTVLHTTHVEIMETPWRVHEMIGEAVDHCFSNPCANNGTCNNSLYGYRCSCPEGFTGSLCDEAVDHCFSSPCANNGTCNNSLHGYRCSCPEGFAGSLCEEVDNEDNCGSSPCINDGTCITVGRSYQCDCRRGFYGRQCQLGCGFRELGLKVPNTRRIPDKDITASSRKVEGRSSYRGRIGVEKLGSWEDGWCAASTDTAPYIQVFFGYLTNVTVIETEGVTDGATPMWVESYYVSTSNNSETESFVNYTEGGNIRIFRANEDINGRNVSLYGTSAHYIRIHPVTYHGTSACLRMAMYGCDSEDFPSLGVVLQRSDDEPKERSSWFDTRYAVIPAVIFIALLTAAIIFLLRSCRRKYSGKLKGYSELDEDGIYENIPIDASMFEVQTVAIDIGPEKSSSAVYGKGVWRETTFSLSRQVHQYHNAVYEEMDIDKTEFETQTLKVDVGTDEVAKDVSYTKGILSEDTTSLSGLAFESQLMNEIYDDPFPGFFCTDAEEQEEIYEARYKNLINEEDGEDDYDDVFPNFPSNDAQRMTLELSPQKTVLVEGIFSEENKIFSFNRINTLPSRVSTLQRAGNTLPNGKSASLQNGRSSSTGGRNTLSSVGTKSKRNKTNTGSGVRK